MTFTHGSEDCLCRSWEIFRGPAKARVAPRIRHQNAKLRNLEATLLAPAINAHSSRRRVAERGVRAIGCTPDAARMKAWNVVRQRLRRFRSAAKEDKLSPSQGWASLALPQMRARPGRPRPGGRAKLCGSFVEHSGIRLERNSLEAVLLGRRAVTYNGSSQPSSFIR